MYLKNINRFVFVFVLSLVWHMLLVSLTCPFLIVPSSFSNVYFNISNLMVDLCTLKVKRCFLIMLAHTYIMAESQQYFSYIVEDSFIGRGNRSTWRKPPTCRKSVTNLSHKSWFQQHFSYIVEVSLFGGRNWSTRREQPTCRKSKSLSGNGEQFY